MTFHFTVEGTKRVQLRGGQLTLLSPSNDLLQTHGATHSSTSVLHPSRMLCDTSSLGGTLAGTEVKGRKEMTQGSWPLFFGPAGWN